MAVWFCKVCAQFSVLNDNRFLFVFSLNNNRVESIVVGGDLHKKIVLLRRNFLLEYSFFNLFSNYRLQIIAVANSEMTLHTFLNSQHNRARYSLDQIVIHFTMNQYVGLFPTIRQSHDLTHRSTHIELT